MSDDLPLDDPFAPLDPAEIASAANKLTANPMPKAIW